MSDIASKLKNSYSKAVKAGFPAKDFKGLEVFIKDAQKLEKDVADFEKKAEVLKREQDKLSKEIDRLGKQTRNWDNAFNNLNTLKTANKTLTDELKSLRLLFNQIEYVIQKGMQKAIELGK